MLALLMPFAADRIGVIHGRREALDTVAEKACAESSQDRCQVAVAMRAAYAADDIVDLAIWQFFAGIVGIGFVGLTLKATRDAVKEANAATETASTAVDAAREANNIQRAAIAAQHRPWMALQGVVVTSGLAWTERGEGRLEFEFKFQNVGNGPAHGVFVDTELLVDMSCDLADEVSRIQTVSKNITRNWGMVRFPGQLYTQRHSLPISVEALDAAGAKLKKAGIDEFKALFVMLVGSLGYRSSQIGGSHSTPFVFMLERMPDDAGNIAFHVGEDVPRDQIRLKAWPVQIPDPD